jgi:hypothetical protein
VHEKSWSKLAKTIGWKLNAEAGSLRSNVANTQKLLDGEVETCAESMRVLHLPMNGPTNGGFSQIVGRRYLLDFSLLLIAALICQPWPKTWCRYCHQRICSIFMGLMSEKQQTSFCLYGWLNEFFYPLRYSELD